MIVCVCVRAWARLHPRSSSVGPRCARGWGVSGGVGGLREELEKELVAAADEEAVPLVPIEVALGCVSVCKGWRRAVAEGGIHGLLVGLVPEAIHLWCGKPAKTSG